jgi:ubiquinone/menaquinone biosynthesis C-methylase UbiE
VQAQKKKNITKMAAVLSETERLLKMEGVKLIAELLFSKVGTVFYLVYIFGSFLVPDAGNSYRK